MSQCKKIDLTKFGLSADYNQLFPKYHQRFWLVKFLTKSESFTTPFIISALDLMEVKSTYEPEVEIHQNLYNPTLAFPKGKKTNVLLMEFILANPINVLTILYLYRKPRFRNILRKKSTSPKLLADCSFVMLATK